MPTADILQFLLTTYLTLGSDDQGRCGLSAVEGHLYSFKGAAVLDVINSVYYDQLVSCLLS